MTRTRKHAAILTAAVLALQALAGCESYTTGPTVADLTRIAQDVPAGPTKDALQGTAVARYVEAEMLRQEGQAAQATADAARLEHERQIVAMTAEAQAAERARADAAQATRQALDAIERTQNLNATATAQVLAGNAQATRSAIEATAQAFEIEVTRQAAAARATATAEQSAITATAQARREALEATQVQATAQAIERLERRERLLEPVRAAGWLLLLLGGGVIVALLLWKFGQAIADRARLIRRDAGEGEPVMLISRERMALPLRQFGAYADLTQGQERAPLLAPTVEAQDAATLRQQTANAYQARQAGQIAQAKASGGAWVVVPSGRGPATLERPKRRREAGLLGPVGREGVPPKLLEGIVSDEWEVIE